METKHLSKEDLVAIQKVIGDMRFIQAAALVANGLNEQKQAKAYMHELGRLDRLLKEEINAKIATNQAG